METTYTTNLHVKEATMGTTNTGCTVKSRTVADNLKDLADDIAKLAISTESRVDERICSVMNDLPALKNIDDRPPQEVWPPLFNKLRESLESIRVSLNGINKMMDRVEL